MTLDEYQSFTRTTAIYPAYIAKEYCAMKLCGESGEVAEKIAKVHRDNDGLFTHEINDALAKELGDVLWYVSQLADELGYSLDMIAEMNMEKLKSRQARGQLHGSGDNR